MFGSSFPQPEPPEPQAEAAPPVGANDFDPVRRDKVASFRLDRLMRLGFVEAQARVMAARRDIDLHDTERMLARGCPPDTAFLILT